jgi:AhpD family alkylhydroperoxidase
MQKLNYFAQAKPAFDKFMELEGMLKESSIEASLRHLVKIYASQINGCALCVDMHCKEAKIGGERELRIYHLPVWHESPLFSEREKAALQWTRAVTQLSQGPVSEDLYQSVKKHFNDKEMTDLTMIVAMINMWNRFGAPFTSTPGAMDKVMGLDKAGLA